MKTVKEVSRLAGVSVRTLHYYDRIGLLKPTARTEAGYRLYSDADVRRLQTILLFRELDFPLSDIRELLTSPDFDPKAALECQVSWLTQRRDRLNGLISLADSLLKGENIMDFSAFEDKSQGYKAEAKEKWGSTPAYAAYEKHGYPPEEEDALAADLMGFFARFGELKTVDAASDEAQKTVADLQAFITEHYYPCPKEMLLCLGEMYVGDDRFRANIDKAGGEGTARFARDAITEFCK